MKNNKLAILLSGLVIVLLIALIAGLSVKNASDHGYAGGFSGFSFGGQAELRNTIEIPMSEIDSLNVEYGSKDLRIFTGDNDKVVIKEYLVNDSQQAWAQTEIVDRQANVKGGKNSTFMIFGFNIDERIEIYLPEEDLDYLTLSTKSGNISVQPGYSGNYEWMALAAGSGNIKWSNTTTAASIAAGSGNVKLENMTGNIAVGTGSGNVNVDELAGELEASAGSGNITVTALSGQGSMEAGSGNVKVQVSELTGDISLEASSGNAKLELPEETSAHLKLESGSGNIDTDIDDILSYNKDGNQADGNMGENPVNQIKVSTGSGNVRVNVN